MSRILISKAGKAPITLVEIDGVDISTGITNLTLNMGAGRPAILEVQLLAEDILLVDEATIRADVSDALSKVLVAAGWTPPISDTPPITIETGALTVEEPS